ncbi:uncharacterized protein BDV14DRAFT_194077 [Aspergillus stella-maris]|uniref:uncharacterized protein n=1 Tax=Aspergillus stella-maris TaxID=1810926 RepID=UPI003CCD7AD6
MKLIIPVFLALSRIALGSITILDTSDYADLAADAADNALVADYTTDNGGAMYQTDHIAGRYFYSDEEISLFYETLSVNANDTSVLVLTNGSTANLSNIEIIKEGYCTWLNQASFFGVNAAINIANASTANITNLNITVHNGAANIFAYGTGTTVYVSNTDLYSSGPVSHGLYAAGNGTIYAKNVRHYSGGNRCSSFSGDTPAGYVHVRDSIAHTAGIGSAIFYALGEIYGANVVGVAEKSPTLFSDGGQKAAFENVDLTAGLLAGTVMFSSQERLEGASISFTNSRLTTLTGDMPALWFGNVIADASIILTELNTTSGVLVVANSSQVTQSFDAFVGVEQNSAIQPAEVSVLVTDSTLVGDLVAYNGSSISWNLTEHSSWIGTASTAGNGTGIFSVALDETSTWALTGDVSLEEFTNADASNANVDSGGYNIYVGSSSTVKVRRGARTVSLPGGGQVRYRV